LEKEREARGGRSLREERGASDQHLAERRGFCKEPVLIWKRSSKQDFVGKHQFKELKEAETFTPSV